VTEFVVLIQFSLILQLMAPAGHANIAKIIFGSDVYGFNRKFFHLEQQATRFCFSAPIFTAAIRQGLFCEFIALAAIACKLPLETQGSFLYYYCDFVTSLVIGESHVTARCIRNITLV
jgi:hypothetical protein